MNIFKIDKYDVNNGPGIRTSIWTSGCKHHCKGCWAADTWNPNIGKPLEEWLEIIEEYLKEKVFPVTEENVRKVRTDLSKEYIDENLSKTFKEILKNAVD